MLSDVEREEDGMGKKSWQSRWASACLAGAAGVTYQILDALFTKMQARLMR